MRITADPRTPIRFLGALLVLLALGLSVPAQAEAQATVHQVVITVDVETGALSYSLDPVIAFPGDLVEFVAPQGSWRVTFNQQTPFVEQSIANDQPQPRRVPIRGNAEPGSYKYTVFVTIGDQTYSEDPEVIVRGRGEQEAQPGTGGF
jgi:plastocyanin